MCEHYGSKPVYTAVYFQRENPVERKVADLKKTLRTLQYSQYPRDRWDEHLQAALGILRSRKNRATGETPSKALLGYEIAKRGQWGIDEYYKSRNSEKRDAAERRRIIRARQLDFQEKTYPRTNERPPVTFRRGDRVMLKEYNPTDPFAPVWSGPHQIAVRKSPEIYEVDKNGRQFQYHVDQLRPAPSGNHDVPPDLSSDDDEAPNAETPQPADSFSSEDEGEPSILVTTAQIHTSPSVSRLNRPADTEVELETPSTSGKLVTRSKQGRDFDAINAINVAEDHIPEERPSQGAAQRSTPPRESTPDEAQAQPDERPGRRTPPEFHQPGPVILRRPRSWSRRWRKPLTPTTTPGTAITRSSDGECARIDAKLANTSSI